MLLYSILLGATLLLQQGQGYQGHHPRPIAIPDVPKDSNPVSRDLQSFSIEFAYFPDFAGNKSHPNGFSKALLGNLEKITGILPKVRVGGTTQDHATYFPHQKESIHLIYQNPSDDQPKQINYGPGFFDSYHTLGDVKYIHGLNLNQSDSTHLETAASQACKSIGSKLHLLELGNEFNLAPMMYRPSNYSIDDYIHEWNARSKNVKKTVQKACSDFPGLMAPSFMLLDGIDIGPILKKLPMLGQGSLPSFIDPAKTAEKTFNHGYDDKNLIKELSFHNYMGLSLPMFPAPHNDLQKNLMNHTSIVQGLKSHVQRAQKLAYLGHPYILGETNSIGVQGRDGETNVFGDALWVVDFSFWAAEHSIQRLHFHQGLDYRYGSWQPIQSQKQAPTTRAPYYGHIMVASAVGSSGNTRVVNIPLQKDTESAYAIYDGDKPTKLAIINLQAFNHTTHSIRPSRSYSFQVPEQFTSAKAERLIAPGSDVSDKITFGGVSYDYDLKQGKPAVTDPKEKTTAIQNGILSIALPDSSAVLLTLK